RGGGIAGRALEVINYFAHELCRIGNAQETGQTVDFESGRPEIFDADTHFLKSRQVPLDPVSVARGQVERLRQEERLSWHASRLHVAAHLLEEDSRVSGVLVNEDEAIGIFHQHVELA